MRRSGAPDGGVSDEALLAGMAVGDESAGVSFVRRYQRRVFGLALSMVGDHSQAEDIAQEALVRAWRHAPVFDSRRASAATWVLTITRNLAVDSLRRRRALPMGPDEMLAMSPASLDCLPEQAAEGADGTARMRSALATLPPEQRRALVMAAVYGYTAAEVGEVEPVPLGTAKTRIRLGLMKLRALAVATGGLV